MYCYLIDIIVGVCKLQSP